MSVCLLTPCYLNLRAPGTSAGSASGACRSSPRCPAQPRPTRRKGRVLWRCPRRRELSVFADLADRCRKQLVLARGPFCARQAPSTPPRFLHSASATFMMVTLFGVPVLHAQDETLHPNPTDVFPTGIGAQAACLWPGDRTGRMLAVGRGGRCSAATGPRRAAHVGAALAAREWRVCRAVRAGPPVSKLSNPTQGLLMGLLHARSCACLWTVALAQQPATGICLPRRGVSAAKLALCRCTRLVEHARLTECERQACGRGAAGRALGARSARDRACGCRAAAQRRARAGGRETGGFAPVGKVADLSCPCTGAGVS